MDDHILEEEAIAEERAIEKLGPAITRLPIRSLPTLKQPVCVKPSTTVREAIEAMNQHRVGCVLVEERQMLTGVFSERDVLTKLATCNANLDTTLVADVMTADPECLTLDDGVVYALNKMSVGGFRHVPLIDAEGRPTGVVSMRDIVDFIVDLFPSEVLNLPPSPAHSIARQREGA